MNALHRDHRPGHGARFRTLRFHFGPLMATLVVAALASAPAASAEQDDMKASQAAMGALKLAKHYYDNQQFAKAAERFHEAFAIDPKPAFLFNAARSEQRAFQLDEAERDFRQYLELKGVTARGKHLAGVHLQEITAYRENLRKAGASQDNSAPADEPTIATPAAPAATTRQSRPGPLDVLTVGLYAGSGISLLSAAVIYINVRRDRQDINTLVVANADDHNFHDQQIQEQDQTRLMAVGLAVAGVGLAAWALTRPLRVDISGDVADVRLTPWSDGAGLNLQGRF